MKKEIRKKFINLFFNDGEETCFSDNKFATFSLPTNDLLKDKITLKSSGKKQIVREVDTDYISLCSINPVKGSRCDDNVTAFRSFLVELDDGTFKEQFEYIQEKKMPFSIAVFSGNKSIHFGIVLKEDLPSIEYWRFVCQWILNIMEKADQQTKNPTRSIRVPNAIRKDTKKEQKIIKIRDRIEFDDLLEWLNRFPDKKPKPMRRKRDFDPTLVGFNEYKNVPLFVQKKLEDGIYENRNNEWFKIACVFASKMWDLEETIDYLDKFFVEESDFNRKEWLTCIKSGFKTVFKV